MNKSENKDKDIKKNEALLVKQIDSSLEKYIKSLGLNFVSFTPPSTDQNFRNLNKYCGDIVASIGNISALILEVKYNSKGRLNNLNEAQKSGLVELSSRGVPVFYSYNFYDLKFFPNEAGQQLKVVTAIKPSHQTNLTAILDSATNLKEAVDFLLNNTPPDNALAIALASFVDSEKCIANSGIEKLTTKALLLIYDHKTQNLAVLSHEAAFKVIQQVINNDFIAASKNSKDLSTAIEQFLEKWHIDLDSSQEQHIQENKKSRLSPK